MQLAHFKRGIRRLKLRIQAWSLEGQVAQARHTLAEHRALLEAAALELSRVRTELSLMERQDCVRQLMGRAP
jgi:hypothetical protein